MQNWTCRNCGRQMPWEVFNAHFEREHPELLKGA